MMPFVVFYRDAENHALLSDGIDTVRLLLYTKKSLESSVYVIK